MSRFARIDLIMLNERLSNHLRLQWFGNPVYPDKHLSHLGGSKPFLHKQTPVTSQPVAQFGLQ